MYAIIDSDNILRAFEIRDLLVTELVHPDFAHLYIPIQPEEDVQVGDMYDRNTDEWIRSAARVTSAQ